ncbi:MAG: GatB/YqeY domain-containing protein [Candidatus Berkelbacteria bacterium]|nr:GatB/YqeY domain-containing protein [Candidatus Berkelbacteria bacterium]
MSLIDQIESDYVDALKTKEAEKVSVLRMLKSALQNSKIQLQKELTDDDVIKTVQSQIKQRKDSIATYQTGGRAELADKEKAEIEILSVYMPEQLSDEELTAIVKSAIAETGATSAADMGKVMGKVMPQVAGKANGGQISTKVKELLS